MSRLKYFFLAADLGDCCLLGLYAHYESSHHRQKLLIVNHAVIICVDLSHDLAHLQGI